MLTRRHLLGLLSLPALGSTDPAGSLEMVSVAHRDLAKVRALAARHPGLIRAAFDGGFGDWESALGAASHVGNRAIAEFLLANGETPTIFSAAMLGQLDLVKSFLTASPSLERAYGPHGITLLSHARAGGPSAVPVVQYLTSLGHADIPIPTQPLSAADRDSILGRYIFGPSPTDHYIVDVVKEKLGIDRPGSPGRRNLLHAGNLTFFPTGAPWAKISFLPDPSRFTLSGIGPVLTATRR